MASLVLNLPAVYLGVVLHLMAGFLHIPFPSGEPTELAFGTVFVPMIWYRIGRWIDDLATDKYVGKTSHLNVKAVWTGVTRDIVWFLFAILLLSLLVEGHRESNATKFMVATAILWTGGYLGCGVLGDRRRKAQLRTIQD